MADAAEAGELLGKPKCAVARREVSRCTGAGSKPSSCWATHHPLWTACWSKPSPRGWAWVEEVKAGATIQAIAKHEGITERRVAHLVNLAFLAQDIVRSNVEGCQPHHSPLTA
jgi:hypothetical protein